MITKQDHRTIRSLHALVSTSMWPDVKASLEADVQRILDALCVCSDPVTIHELRGQANALKKFLQIAGSTRELIEKFERVKT